MGQKRTLSFFFKDKNNANKLKNTSNLFQLTKTSFNESSPYMYYVNHKFHQNNNTNSNNKYTPKNNPNNKIYGMLQ